VRPLQGVVQHYEWGDERAIPDLLGVAPDARPWAELWFGTHRGGPSLVRTDDGLVPLSQHAGDLSFLVKVIAAARPLSLQTHPDDVRAAAGYRAEDASGVPLDAPQRLYRDQSAKPELLVALTPFEAICGFRDPAASLADCRAHRWDELGDRLERDGLAGSVRWALADGPHRLPANLPAWAAQLADAYPGHGGVLVALLMHHVVLQPGEALFLGAGNVHAYLSGTGLEVMASSDNVVRAAFTRKHVDVDEFLAIATLSAGAPPVVRAERGTDGRSAFALPIAHFGLERIDVDGHTTVGPARGTEMLVCTDGDAGVLARGQAGILRDGDAAELRGVATVFRAWGRH
jgi:mannose-6-phosphate isomerase